MRYPEPDNEHAFEEFCLVLLREHWKLPSLDRYGKRGERQQGIDLLDTGGAPALRAVQCKHHEATKALAPKELQNEVDKAKTFPEKLSEFWVLTTARKSTHAQRRLREINKEHAAKGLFVVYLLFWADIERIVDDCPNSQEALGVQSPKLMRGLIRAELKPIQTAVGAVRDDAHGSDLDEVKKHLTEGQVSLATLLLRRLRTRSWDQFSARSRYRWHTLQADAEMRGGNESAAGKLLVEARAYQPDDHDAVANEIVGYELLGSKERASELAGAALSLFPHSGRIYASVLRLARSAEALDQLFADRPDTLRDDAEVWIAAATTANAFADVKQAEARARRATVLAPDDSRGWFALGLALLRTEVETIDPEAPPARRALAPARAEEAVVVFSKVIELARKDGAEGVVAQVLVRRAIARSLQGDHDAAAVDAGDAYRLAPDDAFVLSTTAQIAGDRNDYARAVELLRQASMRQRDDNHLRFQLAIALWNRDAPGDRLEAVAILIEISAADSVHLEPATELATEGLVVQGRGQDALAHLESVKPRLEPAFHAASKARVLRQLDRADEAAQVASDALASISTATSRTTLRRLARLLGWLGRHQDSLQVWRRLLVPNAVNDDTRAFVECAARLGRDKDVLDVCGGLRNIGRLDPYLVECEVRLLDKYEPEAALAILGQFLEQHPNHKQARLQRAHLALRLGKKDIAAAQVPHLPSVTEASAFEGAAVVTVLASVDRSDEAVAYAYDLLRRHFQDHHAHRAFRNSVFYHPDKRELAEIVEVAPGTAVCLSEAGSTIDRWYVLEDSSVKAANVPNEIAADAPLARLLIGRRVGEQVSLSEGPGIGRAATIREVVKKTVFRVRDVSEQWQYRFPDHQEMWMVRVPETKEGDPPDFSALFEMAREGQRLRKEAELLYANRELPIFLFSVALRESDVFAQGHIAGSDDLVLRCCLGTADEYRVAGEAWLAAAEVVLDITALTTLMLLDALSLLDSLGKKILVTPATLAAVRGVAENARSHSQSVGTMGADESGPRLYVNTPEAAGGSIAAAEKALRFVEERCEVVGSQRLAELDPDRRKLFEQAVGLSTLETGAVAALAGRVMWTDDGVAAQLLQADFGTKRVWTQSVLRSLTEQGVIPADNYVDASAKLLGWKYMFTSVNPDVLRAAGRQAEWNCDRTPLKQVFWYLALPAVGSNDAAFFAARLVAHCYLETMLPEPRHRLLQHLAEALAGRPDQESALQTFRTLLARVFGLNVTGQQDALRTFDAWRRAQTTRLITTWR